MKKGQNPKIRHPPHFQHFGPPINFAFYVKNKKSVMKFMFALSVGFQNGMS